MGESCNFVTGQPSLFSNTCYDSSPICQLKNNKAYCEPSPFINQECQNGNPCDFNNINLTTGLRTDTCLLLPGNDYYQCVGLKQVCDNCSYNEFGSYCFEEDKVDKKKDTNHLYFHLFWMIGVSCLVCGIVLVAYFVLRRRYSHYEAVQIIVDEMDNL
jgi:hypothetical protein